MRDYDRLPPALRQWLASAVLPWRPASVKRAFDRAYAQSRDIQRALEQLDRLQDQLVAKDVGRIWGPDHPMLFQAYRAGKRHKAQLGEHQDGAGDAIAHRHVRRNGAKRLQPTWQV